MQRNNFILNLLAKIELFLLRVVESHVVVHVLVWICWPDEAVRWGGLGLLMYVKTR